MISKEKLEGAGIVSVLSAATTIPYIILSIIALGREDSDTLSDFLFVIVDVILMFMWLYCIVVFRKLLNIKARFFEVNSLIKSMILMSFTLIAFDILSLFGSVAEDLFGFLSILAVVAYSIIYIIFGIKLKHCQDNLYGHLNSLSILIIISGVFTVSVILVPLALITSVISSIIFAQIFFKAAKEF